MATSPTFVGRYQVIKRLGAGGMGAVYLARDPELDRELAIKLVKDDLSDDPDLRERFSREARSAARLRHPNIVTVFDIGEQDGCPFIAMEFVSGDSLADRLRRQDVMDVLQILTWVESLCLGLAHAHRAGIVHRDVKPANMMVDADGTLKIVDFGIARLADSQMTREGVLIGTINYMAPEAILGKASDHRTDIFAVGAVFYELLTGQKAFPGTIADGLFTRIVQTDPVPVESIRPDLDSSVGAVVRKAIAKNPDDRYQDLALMARDVAALRQRVSNSAESFATVLMPPPDAAGVATQAVGASRFGLDGLDSLLGTDRDDEDRRARAAVEARERTERVRAALERGRQALSQGAPEQAVRAVEDALAADTAAPGAYELLAEARSALEERQRQAAVQAARRVIDAAAMSLDAGDPDGAEALLDAVKAPTDNLVEAVKELRTKIADARRQRQRRADIFVDAAELALATGDVAKAYALADDAHRVDPTAPAVVALHERLGAQREAEAAAAARKADVDAALDAAQVALSRGDLAHARECVARAQRLDPGNYHVSSMAGRIRQAEQADEVRLRRIEQDEARTRQHRTLLIVAAVAVVVVVVVALWLFV